MIISSKFFNFPISNLDIVISSGTTFNINDNFNIDLYPSSTLTNNGTIVIGNNAKFNICDFDLTNYNSILNNANISALDKTTYSFLKQNYLSKNLVINNGIIKITSTSSGIYTNNAEVINHSIDNLQFVENYNFNTSNIVKLPSSKNKLNYTAKLSWSGYKFTASDPTIETLVLKSLFN